MGNVNLIVCKLRMETEESAMDLSRQGGTEHYRGDVNGKSKR